MTTYSIVPELTLVSIALGLDMPTAPPIAPPDPHEAIADLLGYRDRAEQLLRQAQTPAERMEAELWIDNADRNLHKWRAVAERGQR